jgi:hypothetical protein
LQQFIAHGDDHNTRTTITINQDGSFTLTTGNLQNTFQVGTIDDLLNAATLVRYFNKPE